MKELNVVSSEFKVVRELEIEGERTVCEYLNRYQLHDIKEFVSSYLVLKSTGENLDGKIILGFEKFDGEGDCVNEQFFLAPNEVYKYKDFMMCFFHIEKIVWEYFEKTYTEKTGLADYNNLWMESAGDDDELVPVYDENKYMNRKFEERAVEKVA